MKDTVALPIAGEHIVASCRNASGSFYEGVGHAPFVERPERFNRELARSRQRHFPESAERSGQLVSSGEEPCF